MSSIELRTWEPLGTPGSQLFESRASSERVVPSHIHRRDVFTLNLSGELELTDDISGHHFLELFRGLVETDRTIEQKEFLSRATDWLKELDLAKPDSEPVAPPKESWPSNKSVALLRITMTGRLH